MQSIRVKSIFFSAVFLGSIPADATAKQAVAAADAARLEINATRVREITARLPAAGADADQLRDVLQNGPTTADSALVALVSRDGGALLPVIEEELRVGTEEARKRSARALRSFSGRLPSDDERELAGLLVLRTLESETGAVASQAIQSALDLAPGSPSFVREQLVDALARFATGDEDSLAVSAAAVLQQLGHPDRVPENLKSRLRLVH